MELNIDLKKQSELLEKTKKSLNELNMCIEEINKDFILKDLIDIKIEITVLEHKE